MQKEECNLLHEHNWIQFFVPVYNDIIFENYFIIEMQERGEFILS
jgi:putative transposase